MADKLTGHVSSWTTEESPPLDDRSLHTGKLWSKSFGSFHHHESNMANPVDLPPSNGISAFQQTRHGSIDTDSISLSDVQWEDKTPTKFNLSFAGCGFLGIYHLGVADALVKHGSQFLDKVQCFAGASAGSLVAAVMAVKGKDPDAVQAGMKFCMDSAVLVHQKPMGLLTPGFDLLEPVRIFLEEIFPADAHIIASGKMHVSLTCLDTRKNVIVSEFESKDDLIKCLLASSYVPLVTGRKPVTRKGKKYIDGGMTDNLPVLGDGRTVFISPFSGKQDICPHDKPGKNLYLRINNQDFQVNASNLVRGLHAFKPPKLKELEVYFEKGVRDATYFLKKEKMYEDSPPPDEPSLNTSRTTILEYESYV